MSLQQRDPFDEDDYFQDTRMSFGEHLEELRGHLIRAALWLFGFVFLGFALDGVGYLTGWTIGGYPFGVGNPALHVISAPVETALKGFYDKRKDRLKQEWEEKVNNGEQRMAEVTLVVKGPELARGLGLPTDRIPEKIRLNAEIDPEQVGLETFATTQKLGKRPGLTTLSAQEAILAWFKVTLVLSLILSSPMVFWEIWAFVAAGLYPSEKKLVRVYMPFSIGLFLAGVVLCERLVLPRAVAVLLMFNEWLGLEPDLRFNEWLSLAIWLPVIFGLCFQLPLVMLFLERIGIFGPADYRAKRRWAYFIITLIVTIFMPLPDGVSIVMLLGPMLLLYELGIKLCEWLPRPVWQEAVDEEQVAGV